MHLARSISCGLAALLCLPVFASAQQEPPDFSGHPINLASYPGDDLVGDEPGTSCGTSCGPAAAGCGSCDVVAPCYAPAYRVSGGAEIVWLEPHLNNGGALIQFDNVEPGSGVADLDGVHDMAVQSLEFDKDTALRTWLAVENCQGLGSRVRYFYYNQDAEPRGGTVDAQLVDALLRDIGVAQALALQEGATLYVTSNLELQTLDLEVTKAVQLCPVTLTFAGGFRWARTDSLLLAQTNNTGDDGDPGYRVDAVFDGYGPTFGMNARHPLYGGRLALVGGLRTSVMFGNGDVTVVGVQNPDTWQVGRDSGLFIGELMLGLEYRKRFCHGPELLIRTAWDGQYWTGMPLATRMGDDFSDADSMFLEGISLAAGLTF